MARHPRRSRRDRPYRTPQSRASPDRRAVEDRSSAGLHGRRRNHHGRSGRGGAGRPGRAHARGDGRASGPVAGEPDAGRGMGCTRAGRAGQGRAHPPAISSQAPARPDRCGPRRSPAVALFGPGIVAAGAVAGDRQRDGGAGFLAQMGDPPPGRTAAGRNPGRRAARQRRRSPGDRFGAARGAGDAGQDRRTGHARPPACKAGGRAARAVGDRSRRQRRNAIIADRARDLAARDRVGRGRGIGPGAAARARQAPAGRRGRRRAAGVAGRCSGDRPQASWPASAGRPRRTRFDAGRPRVAARPRPHCSARRTAERTAFARSVRQSAGRGDPAACRRRCVARSRRQDGRRAVERAASVRLQRRK